MTREAGNMINRIDQNDNEFSIIGRRPFVLMAAFKKNDLANLEGYTEFSAEEVEMPYQADGKRFKRESIRFIANH